MIAIIIVILNANILLMNYKKPEFEIIQPEFGTSYSFVKYTQNKENNTTYWHYHPEIELVYVDEGAGKRQIGSHVSYFTSGDLLLIGPNLPHCGFTDRLTGNKREYVIQMTPDFLGKEILTRPEMANIARLFERCKKGMAFHGRTKERIGEKISLLEFKPPFQRLLGILEVLNELNLSEDYQLLNASGFSVETEMQDNERINLIFNYVRSYYTSSIALEEIAHLVSMTIPSFCRYFKKISGKTFTKFVNEYRVVHACKLLAEKPIPITEVCLESGFNNFSHFNKTFKQYTGKSPSNYRNQLKLLLTDEG